MRQGEQLSGVNVQPHEAHMSQNKDLLVTTLEQMLLTCTGQARSKRSIGYNDSICQWLSSQQLDGFNTPQQIEQACMASDLAHKADEAPYLCDGTTNADADFQFQQEKDLD